MRQWILSLADRWYGFSPDSILPLLEETQFWPKEDLEQLQVNSLRKLLIHAGTYVPFYRDLFKKIGFNAQQVTSARDIRTLPVIDKQHIMAEVNRFVSETAKKPVVWLKTTGTTGHPFSFVRTRLAQSYKIASRIRFRRWYGVERTDPLLNVGGIPSLQHSLRQWFHHHIHFFATNRIEVYSSELSGNGSERAIHLIEKHQPKAIMGYPTGIAALAQYILDGHRLTYRPQAIFTNSETLSDKMRQQIHEGLGVEPRADYVTTEGSIAHECPQGSLHIDMEEALVELLPIHDGDDMGKVVVTFLHSFDFPLIRYSLGDVARWAGCPCRCGRGLMALDGLLGRFADAIQLPNGKFYTAANINMRIAHLPAVRKIRQYQIAQTEPDQVELRVLDEPELDTCTIEQLANALREIFRPIHIRPIRKKEIPRERSGKFRPVIGLKTASAQDAPYNK